MGTVVRQRQTVVLAMVENITEQKRGELALKQSNAELSALNRIGQVLSSPASLQERIDAVVGITAPLFGATVVSVNLLDETQSQITVFSVSDWASPDSTDGENRIEPGDADASFLGLTYQVGENPLVDQLFVERKGVVISNLQSHPDLAEDHEMFQMQDLRPMIIVPLVQADAVFGILVVSTTKQGREFTSDEVSLAETIASQIARAVEAARLSARACSSLLLRKNGLAWPASCMTR